MIARPIFQLGKQRMVPVLVEWEGPMHQQQIHIVRAERFEDQVQVLFNATMIRAPDFGREEYFGSGDARCFDTISNLCF